MKALKCISILLIMSNSIFSMTDGTLDVSFHAYNKASGIVHDDISMVFKATTIQADGKIIAVGYSQEGGKNSWAVVRYNHDGSLDTSFANKGKAITHFGINETASGAQAVVLQPDGKIVVGGFTNCIKNKFAWCLARYNQDGSPDTSFFSGRGIFKGTVITTFGAGEVASHCVGLCLTHDGKIVAIGTLAKENESCCAVARYRTDGSLDTQMLNKDGKESIAGTRIFNFNASMPNADQANCVALQRNGKIVIAGNTLTNGTKIGAIARLLPNGDLDSSFGDPLAVQPGITLVHFGAGQTKASIHALLIQADDKIIVGGASDGNSYLSKGRFSLARFEQNGHLDSSFGGYGLAPIPGTVISSFGLPEEESVINSLTLKNDGKITAAGLVRCQETSYLATARYHTDGSVDDYFNGGDAPAGKVLTRMSNHMMNEIFATAIDHNGALIAVGKTGTGLYHEPVVVRYLNPSSNTLQGPVIKEPTHGTELWDGSAVILSGTTQNHGMVHLYLNGKPVGSTVAQPDGSWRYIVSLIKNGDYTFRAGQYCEASRTMLPLGEPITITLDPKPKCDVISNQVFQDRPVVGKLNVKGGSGKYSYEIVAQYNGTVTIEEDTYNFMPTASEGKGGFIYAVTDLKTKATSRGRVEIMIKSNPLPAPIQLKTDRESIIGLIEPNVSDLIPPFNFTLVGTPAHGTVELYKNGGYKFIAEPGYNGIAHFEYMLVDRNKMKSKPGLVQIEVQKAPIVHEDMLVTYEGETVIYDLNRLVSGGKPPYRFSSTCPSINVKTCGSVKYKVPYSLSNELDAEYQVTDANGKKSNGILKFTILKRPYAISSGYTTCENVAFSATLVSRVSQGKAPYTFVLASNADHGVVQMDDEGNFTFIPEEHFTGTTSFEYMIRDINGRVSNKARVIIIVHPVPKVRNVQYTICQDNIINNTLTENVAEGLAPYTFLNTNNVVNGSVYVYPSGNFIFIPQLGFFGQAGFEYQVIDSHNLASNKGKVAITIRRKPNAWPLEVATPGNMPVIGSLVKLVSGGTPPYEFSLIDADDNATVAIDNDNNFIVVPKLGFVGTTEFNYLVTDVNHCTANATVRIEVLPAPEESKEKISIEAAEIH